MSPSLNQTWDLESIFPGGSSSPEFETFLNGIERDIPKLQDALNGLDAGGDWTGTIMLLQDLLARRQQAGAFVSCLTAEDVNDQKAKLLSGRLAQMGATFGAVMTELDQRLSDLAQDEWQKLVEHKDLESVSFALLERRNRAKDKLDVESENLITDLEVDGYQAWGRFYDTLVGRMHIEVEDDGKTTRLSVGQAANRIMSPNRDVRKRVFSAWEKAWSESDELFASVLNHLAGSRLTKYRHRNWDSVLREPLEINRMSEQTLDTMWSVIDASKQHFVEFLNRKAQLMGLSGLAWHDVSAPVGQASRTFSYEDARDFIVEHFGSFSQDMAKFANMCFENRWIEAEDRPGKRPGGFCTRLPVSGQSRIFVTFSGTPSNVSTIAHEIGHAYHGHVLGHLPQLARGYAMNVAETASTFAEQIVSDAAVKSATTTDERISLLADKIENSVAMFMNIHARFLFETRFYAARRQGLQSATDLSAMMEQAQKDAFRGALTEYHPHFWASKLHFYITGTPFYNFPYTFGYLFSTGIYRRALAEGASFAEKYVSLLQDTGRMRVEDLAMKHLGVNLTKPDFWEDAVGSTVTDVKEFLEITR